MICYVFGKSQTVINPDLEFKTLTNFKFAHFGDHYITTQTNYKTKGLVLDTVYSCDYNNENKISKERFFRYKNLVDGTTVFSFDSSGRILMSVFYTQPSNQSKYDLNEINISLYQYNSFDSISFIERYSGRRNKLPDTHETKDSVVSVTFGGYTEQWSWQYIGGVKYEYDSLKNLIKQYSVMPESFDYNLNFGNISEFTHTFKYDSLNRVTNESHTTHSLNGYPKDSNSFSNYELIYKYTHNSLIITNNRSPYPYSKMAIKYNSNGNVVNKIETVLNNDGEEWQTLYKFYYDNNDSIIKQIRIYNDSPNSTEFNYFYNKHGG